MRTGISAAMSIWNVQQHLPQADGLFVSPFLRLSQHADCQQHCIQQVRARLACLLSNPAWGGQPDKPLQLLVLWPEGYGKSLAGTQTRRKCTQTVSLCDKQPRKHRCKAGVRMQVTLMRAAAAHVAASQALCAIPELAGDLSSLHMP
jgi:hypothetical protein